LSRKAGYVGTGQAVWEQGGFDPRWRQGRPDLPSVCGPGCSLGPLGRVGAEPTARAAVVVVRGRAVVGVVPGHAGVGRLQGGYTFRSAGGCACGAPGSGVDRLVETWW
jgi:hypothetical protein